jgi:Tfp pilus assembly protein PilF
MRIQRFVLAASAITTLVACAKPVTEAQLQVERGYQYILNREWPAAEEDMLKALEADPTNLYALMNLGFVYEQTGRDTEAMEMYSRVIDASESGLATRSGRSKEQAKSLATLAERNLRMMRYRRSRI